MTFADLPAPELQWVETPQALVPHLDGAFIQIKKLLYVFAGYRTLDYVRIYQYLNILIVQYSSSMLVYASIGHHWQVESFCF